MKKFYTLLLGVLSSAAVSMAQLVTIGTGTVTNSGTTYPAPYGNWYWGAKHQFLILASELTSACGVAGNITSLAFNVAAVQGTALTDFTIRMKATSTTSVTTTFDNTGFTTVYGPQIYTETAGWNTHAFSTPFNWDGTSNLLIEVCFNNTFWTNNAQTYYSTAAFQSSVWYLADAAGVCANATGSTSFNRPNMRFAMPTPVSPVMELSKNDINFDTVFVGYFQKDSVYIRNTGCSNLNISNITKQTSNYSFTPSSGTVIVGDSLKVVVTFTPPAVGTYWDTLTVFSNAGDSLIALRGIGALPPVISVAPSSFNVTINSCNDSITQPLTINNTGGYNLNYSITDFYDGFESGGFASWNIGTGFYTRTVTTTNPANGVYSFSLIGGNFNYYNGINHSFTSGTPNYVSYKFMSPVGSSLWNCGVVVGRTTDIMTNDGIADSWIDNSTMTVYLWTPTNGTISVPMIQGQWYQIEYRNINYTAKTFDYYVNGNLIAENLTFWNTNITGIDVIHFMGWDPGQTSNYDEVIIGNDLNEWFFPSILSGTSAPSGSSVVNLKFKSTNVADGIYYGNVFVNSNDPLNPQVVVPCTLTVNGNPNIDIPLAGCPQFDTIMVGATDEDTFIVNNLGCDTLFITNVTSSSSHFVVNSYPANIPPYSSDTLFITFQPTTVASHSTTITVQNNDADTSFCLQGGSIPAPTISFNPTALTTALTCCDSLSDTLKIYNTGGGDLTFEITGDTTELLMLTYGVDMGTEGPNTIAAISQYYTKYNLTQINTTDPATLATALVEKNVFLIPEQETGSAAVFTGFAPVLQNFVNNGGTVLFCGSSNAAVIFNTGLLSGTYNGNANGASINIVNTSYPITDTVNTTFTGTNAFFYYNITNGDAIKIANYSGFHCVTYRPVGQGKVILIGADFFLYNNDVARLIANSVRWNKGFPDWIAITPPMTDTVVPGDSSIIDITFNSCGLIVGTYITNIIVNSNDPLSITDTIPVTLNVVGTPDFQLAALGDTITPLCLDLDSIMANTTSTDTIYIANTGCDTLFLDSLTFTPAEFSLASSGFPILPGQTEKIAVLFSPTSVGNFTGTLNFYTNDLDTVICLKGESFPPPIISVAPDSFNITLACCDSLADTLIVYNTGGSALIFSTNENGAGASYDSTITIIYTGSGTLTNHVFTGAPYNDSLYLTVTLNGDYDSGTEYADLYMDGTFIELIPDGNPSNGTNIIRNYAFGGTQVQTWLSDGQVTITLDNSPNVDAFVGTEIHRARVMIPGMSWLTVNPTADTVALGGDSSILVVDFNSCGLLVGQYTGTIYVNSNDQFNNPVLVPCTLNVVGTADFKLASLSDTIAPLCLDLDSIMEFTTSIDSMGITNTGCDTLWLDSLIFSPTEFSLVANDPYVLPGDTGGVIVRFSPTSVANFTGTLDLYTNDIDTTLCLKGKSFPKPVIFTDPDTFNITLSCSSTQTDTLTIHNIGLNNLIYNIDTSDYSASFDGNGDVIYRNAPTGLPTGGGQLTVEAWIYPQGYSWDGNYTGIVSWGNRNCIGNGFLLSIQSNGRPSMATWCNDFIPGTGSSATLNQWNHIACVLNGTSVTLYMNGVSVSGTLLNTPIFTSTLLSIGSADWFDRYFNGKIDEVRIWNKARTQSEILSTMNTELIGNEPNLVSYWNFDNINANDLAGTNNGSLLGNTNFTNDNPNRFYTLQGNLNDTIAIGDSSKIAVQFSSTGLLIGNYVDSILITSNDPVNNPITIPILMEVIGAGNFEFAALGDTIAPLCLYLDSIMALTASIDSIGITNTGCDTLWIDSLVFSPSVFSLDTFTPFILPGDTGGIIVLFSPDTAGTYSGSVNVYTDDLDTVICLKGYAYPPPVISFNPASLDTTLTCCDSSSVTLNVYNTGGSNLIYDVTGTGLGLVGDTSILVIQETPEWGVDMQNFILTNYGKTSTRITSAQIASTDFSLYDIIITVGEENVTYYNNISANKTKFETFVNSGGIVQYQLANYVGANVNIVGGVNVPNGNNENNNTVQIPSHPIVSGLPITLVGNDANAGYFTNLSGSEQIIVKTQSSGVPTVIEYSYGKGRVIATSMTLGFLYFNCGSYPSSCPVLSKMTEYSISLIGTIPNWINLSIINDTVVPTDSSTIGITFNSCGLVVGTYTTNIIVNSNDPLNNPDTIPVTLNVVGTAQISLSDTCLFFDTIMEFTTTVDTLYIANTGCDTLSGYALTSPNFWIQDSIGTWVDSSAGSILPGDTIPLIVIFAPDSAGPFTGTLSLFSNAGDTVICLNGFAYPRPIICHNPDTFAITIPVCIDTVSDQLLICNSGGFNLNWNVDITTSLSDDFDPGINTAMWTSIDGASNLNCGSVSGNALFFDNMPNRQAATIDINTLFGGTISFYLKLGNNVPGSCEMLDPGNEVYLQYSNNGGGIWNNILTFLSGTYPSFTLVNQSIPPAARTASTRFRVWQPTPDCFGCDNWAIDNFSITVGSSNVIPVPASDTTIAGDTTFVTVFFTKSGLSGGTYTIPMYINSNDPLNPVDTVIVVLTIDTTLTPSPAANDTFVCVGDPTPPLIAVGGQGDTIKWYDDAPLTNLVYTGGIFVSTQTVVGTYTYYVTATDSINGCQSLLDTAFLSVNASPSAPTAGGNSPACTGQNLSLTASIVSGATYSWNGPNGFTSTAQNPIITPVVTAAAGTYSVTATVPGCPASPEGTTTVSVNETPVSPAASSNSPICAGSDLSLTASTVGSSTYNWNGPSSFTSTVQDPVILSAATSASGNYSVTATENGCTGIAGTVSVTVNAIPAAPTAGYNNPACTGQTLSLTASAISGATYSWNGPGGFTSTLQNPTIGSVTTAASGTYSVVVTKNGCTGPAGTVSVTINVTPSAPAASSNSPVCSGTTLSLSANASGSPTYNWNGPNTFASGLQNPTIGSIPILGNGTYSVTATENGCTGPAGTVSVTVNQTPSAPIAGSNSPICVGNDISLTASTVGGATYDWSGPNSFTSTFQNPVIISAGLADGGTYSVTATENGCTGSAGTVNVIVNPPPAAPAAGSNSPVCSGQNLSLTASSTGATYLWNGPNGFTATVQNPVIGNVTTAASGTYSVVAINGGCPPSAESTASVTVYQTPSAPIASSNSPICSGDNLSLSASTSGSPAYSWNGPNSFTDAVQNPVIISATTAETGTYSVTATENGCTGPAGTTSAIINTPPSVPIAGSNSPVCSGQTLSFTASNSGTTYNWNGPNGFTSASQNPSIGSVSTSASGTYSVTATVPGCPTSAEGTTAVTINQTPLSPSASSNSPICAGTDLSLTASTVGGSTYSWNGPNSFTSTVQNPVILGAATSASGNYSVTATENGCTSPVGMVSVTVNSPPSSPIAGSNSPICSGQNLSLTASIISGATYSWSGPNGFTSTLQYPVISSVSTSASGTYSVTATVPGCSASSAGIVSVTINQTPSAPAVGSNSPICAGTDLSLTANVSGGPTYSWSGPNSFTSTSQNPVISATATSDSGTYSVTATENGCTGPAGTVNVTINNGIPIVDLGADIIQCGGTVLLDAGNSGSGYAWSTAETTQTITVSSTGTYSVDVTNSCGTVSDAIVVTINPVPIVNLGADVTQCGGTVLLDAGNPGLSYAWSTTETTQTITVSSTGTYSVTVTDVNGCTASDAIDVIIDTSVPFVNLGGDITQCGGTVLLDAGNPGSIYAWSTTETTQTITVSSTGTYSVSLSNSCGTASDAIDVTIHSVPVVNLGANVIQGGGTVLLDAGNPGSSYAWSTTETTQTITVSSTGTYSVTVTDVNGCTASDVIDVTIVNLGADITRCGGTVLLDAGPGSSYAWSTTETTQTITVSSTGTYSVVITNSSGTASDAIDITIHSVPVVNLGADVTRCGGTVLLDAGNPGSSYAWSTIETTQTITVSSTGTYSVTVTDANSCTDSDAIDVTIDLNVPIVNLGADVTQCGGTLLDAGNSGSSYAWSTAETTQTITVSSTGAYSVDVTNSCGTVSDTIDVTINAVPIVDLGADVTQCGGTVLLDAGNPGSSYAWSNSTTMQTILVSASGTYSVIVTNAAGCTMSDTTGITINPVPAAPVATPQSDSICFGSPNPSFSAVGTNIEWWNDAATTIFEFNGSPFTPTVTATGTYTYYVTQSTLGCKSSSDTVTLTINTIPSIPSALDTTVCSAASIPDLTASGISVQWYSDAALTNLVGAGNSYNTLQTAPGTYAYYVTQSDILTGCRSAADTSTLTIMLSPAAPAANNVAVCLGNPVPPLTSAGTNVQWYSDAALTNLVNTGNTFNTGQTASGIYTYWVTDSLAECVSSPDSVTLFINTLPAEPSANDVTVCYGNPAVLTATGTNPQWYSDVTLINMVGTGSPFNTGITAVGIYTYYVTDFVAGCGSSPADTVALTINPSPLVTANTYSVTIAQGSSVMLTAYNAMTYIWSPAAGLNTTTGQTVVASPTVTTTYTVTGTNQYGCSNSASILVAVNPLGVLSPGDPVQDVNIYPNPAINSFTLEFSAMLETPIDIYMFNTLGEKVMVIQSEAAQGGGWMKHTYLIDTSTFTEGIYNIYIVTHPSTGSGGSVNRRVILFR